jgi:mRNA interferase RelE/StbE
LVAIEWTEDAIRDIEKLDSPVGQRILRKFSWLSNNFEAITPEPLSGEFKGMFKFRIGDWRVLYTIEEQTLVIQLIGHRRQIYNF